MSKLVKYVDVILPLPVKGVFTYYTDVKDLSLGQRVVVQFGSRKLYTAVVNKIYERNPVNYKVKPLLAILDEIPIVNDIQLKFWHWISDYYMCNIGDVMNAALPSSLKLASESKVIINPNFDGDIDNLSQNQIKLLNAFSHKEILTINDILKIIEVKNIFSFINELIRKEILQLKEELKDKYREKEVKIIKYIASKNKLKEIKLTSKQDDFIISYLELHEQNKQKQWIISDLLNKIGFSKAILDALVRKGIFYIQTTTLSRLLPSQSELIEDKVLTDFQFRALEEIKDAFNKKKICLLHGVTSSGKTELYIKLIQEQLIKGKQVLYLLPEISLTTQIISRIQAHFGDKVGFTHSSLNNSERVEVWKAVQLNSDNNVNYSIIIGTRSSVFLPFDNLGLIIIDEEHDSSFKQYYPSPRYHARDVAIYLAYLHQAKVLLGSATPSLETYYNAKINKYALVKMESRYLGIELPKIETIDIRKAHLKKQMNHQFSNELLDAMQQSLDLGTQIILFQNRRGYAPILRCEICSHIPHCKSCDVSLTYHKLNHHLKCHYCGYSEKTPSICSDCGGKSFIDKGFGTEKIEESLIELFPKNIIKRLDYDTTRGKNTYKNIITDFEEGRIDILVGTQMLSKGLDFDNVSLVGILNADSMLYFPDFRSNERAFQLMMQVSGRAGRKGKQGKVLIQTYDEENNIFKLLKKYDFVKFMLSQEKERFLFNYPPYSRLIKITLKHKNQNKLDKACNQLSILMQKSFSNRVLGPEYPLISRIRNFYQKDLILKIDKKESLIKAKNILNIIINNLRNNINFKSIRFIIDVDPF